MIPLRRSHEHLLVVLVALHSLIVGVVFMAAPVWTIHFGGWQGIDPVFFARQAGIFHVVLAAAYLIEYSRYRGVAILVMAKSMAVIFLGSAILLGPFTWAMVISAIGDGAMGLLVWFVHHTVVKNSTAD